MVKTCQMVQNDNISKMSPKLSTWSKLRMFLSGHNGRNFGSDKACQMVQMVKICLHIAQIENEPDRKW